MIGRAGGLEGGEEVAVGRGGWSWWVRVSTALAIHAV